MFGKRSDEGYKNALPGISMKTLCYGEHTLMTEFHLEKGRDLPIHAHPYEQTGYLISGHISLKIGEEVFDVLPGDSWCIPMDVQHGAKIIEDSVALEIFHPARKDYIPKDPRD